MFSIEDNSQVYKDEAYELLAELEQALLELESSPEDSEQIGRVFRTMHTIKGSGAMYGFDEIASFTHEVETVFDEVRSGNLKVTEELINLTLKARDLIRTMLDASDTGASVDIKTVFEVVSSLRELLPENAQNGGGEEIAQSTAESDAQEIETIFRIRFKPAPDIFARGTNPIYILNELAYLGDCSIIAGTDLIPALADIDPEKCYIYWDIILTARCGINAIKDVFIFVEDDCEVKIDVIDSSEEFFEEKEVKRLGEILVERNDATAEDIANALGHQKRIGEVLVDSGLISSKKIESALIEQQHLKQLKEKRQKDESTSSIRVPSQKLDNLVNLVGELVTVQARLTQVASLRNDPELFAIAEEVEHLTAELRDNTLNIRMVPIGTTFGKFRRLVRDLSLELGKEVEMLTEGAETELDKTVIEQLNDPLVHLIRNCIDHGIESPEIREHSGKPRKGIVRLSAFHSGANVLIQIMDDGGGLSRDAIFKKAVAKGLISPDAELNEKEIFNLILMPGFSTAEKVTSVSGRGVGMDVVKQCIESLHGTIEISSQEGYGTTITLKMPLTLAIIDGLLVTVGDDYFVFPLSSVEECVELTHQDVAKSHGRNYLNVRGEIVPYVNLRDKFEIYSRASQVEKIVVTKIDGTRTGFLVDQVIGERQTVIKTLGKLYRNARGISGATIMGDGTIALIVDVPQLIHEAELEEIALN